MQLRFFFSIKIVTNLKHDKKRAPGLLCFLQGCTIWPKIQQCVNIIMKKYILIVKMLMIILFNLIYLIRNIIDIVDLGKIYIYFCFCSKSINCL